MNVVKENSLKYSYEKAFRDIIDLATRIQIKSACEDETKN